MTVKLLKFEARKVAVGVATALSLGACAAKAPLAEMAGAKIVEAGESVALSEMAAAPAIARHLLKARQTLTPTTGLFPHHADMTEAQAYDVQLALLTLRQAQDELVGWKMGGTQGAGGKELHPMFGHFMASDVLPATHFPAEKLTEGKAKGESEVAFFLGKDLPGPTHTEEEVIAAIEAVGIGMELVSPRVRAADGTKAPLNHLIADGFGQGGVILGDKRVPLSEVDWAQAKGQLAINGQVVSEGVANTVMGRDPVAALVWLANNLPKHGHSLKAGQFVITGSVVTPKWAGPGDAVSVSIEQLGEISLAGLSPATEAPAGSQAPVSN